MRKGAERPIVTKGGYKKQTAYEKKEIEIKVRAIKWLLSSMLTGATAVLSLSGVFLVCERGVVLCYRVKNRSFSMLFSSLSPRQAVRSANLN